MGHFTQHLQKLSASIVVNEETEKKICQDFILIRKYVVEMLKQSSLLSPILLEDPIIGKKFNNMLILDFSGVFKLCAKYTSKNSPFLKLRNVKNTEKTSKSLSPSEYMAFLDIFGNLNSGTITRYVRDHIATELERSSSFVHGEYGDIYELDLVVDQHYRDVITIKANSDSCLPLRIDFRMLIKTEVNFRPTQPLPHPNRSIKQLWLAAADICTKNNKGEFSLCAVRVEEAILLREELLVAMRLIVHLFRKQNLIDYRLNACIFSAVFEEYFFESQRRGLKVAFVVIDILKRMLRYLHQKHFPYYWDSRINLLQLFQEKNTENRIREYICFKLDCIAKLEENPLLTLADVQDLFG